MKLKPIKPGMNVNCRTEEEAENFISWAYECGYRWAYPSRDSKTIDWSIYRTSTCYVLSEGNNIFLTDLDSLIPGKKAITKFSDLILPELSAEEVLRTMTEICSAYQRCKGCPLHSHEDESLCNIGTFEEKSAEIIEICTQWKADYEKKEPEIETVDMCRIIEVMPDGKKRCVHEEDIKPDSELPYGSERIAVEEILKRYCMEHEGKYIAVHEVVSRVKY